MHPRGSGKLNGRIAELWAGVRLCPRPLRVHEETHAPQQTTSLFDHLVGAGKHGRYTASVPMPTASSGPTEMGCPRYVRFTDAFLVAPHQDRRHLSEGFGESPLVSRPRGRLNGARIHTLEFSKISEDLR
jgi:hypothetical protein